MTDINELIKSEPYKSCYEYGELVGIKQGRADAIEEALKIAKCEDTECWDCAFGDAEGCKLSRLKEKN